MKWLVTLLCWSVLATPLRTIDGDTFTADARIWPGLTQRETVRVLGVNAPERHGTTKAAGEASKSFTAAWLTGTEVRLDVCTRDAFGRALANVTRVRDGAVLNVDLLREGHAVPYAR